MLTPPSEVTDAVVARAVEQRWGLVAAGMRLGPKANSGAISSVP